MKSDLSRWNFSASSHLPVDERFYWTAEALDIVWRWWEKTDKDLISLMIVHLLQKLQIYYHLYRWSSDEPQIESHSYLYT